MAKDKKKIKKNTDQKSSVTVKNSDSGKTEAVAIIIAAIAILLMICLINKGGKLGALVRSVSFGILGPTLSFGLFIVLIFLAFCILRGTKEKKFRKRNVFLLSFFALFLSMLIFTIGEKTPVEFEFGKMLDFCWTSKFGGLIDGLLSLVLQQFILRPATFVIVITGMLVTSILLFSISIIGFFKKAKSVLKSAVSKSKRIAKRFKDEKNRKKLNEIGKKKEEKAAEPIQSQSEQIVFDPETGEIQDKENSEINMEPEIVPDSKTEEISEKQTENAAEVPNADVRKYVFPPLEILQEPDLHGRESEDGSLRSKSEKLENTMRNFGVNAKVVNTVAGPNVVRFEVEPQAGVKVSQITGLANDIALNMAAKGSIRIEAPIPGKSAIGIEIPNEKRYTVYLKEIIDSVQFKNAKSSLTVCLGKDIAGYPVIADIAKMPHLLIAGTTGSGKSVLMNSLIISILYKASPEEVRFVMLDPKMVELTPYNGLPHMMFPVVTDSKKAAGALSWAVEEMEKRYTLFANAGEKEIDEYNIYAAENNLEKLPRIVIIIDELADLMAVAKDAVETSIERLTAKARAAGIHLVVATQRPSVDVVTGRIKANLSTRISLYVSSFADSKTILDCSGAEKLLGHGDMLYMPGGKASIRRIQSAFCEKEIKKVVDRIISDNNPRKTDETLLEKVESFASRIDKKGREVEAISDHNEISEDEILEDVVRFSLQSKVISASAIQTRFSIGFQRSTRILQWLTDHGIVSERDGNNPRHVLIENMDDFYKLKNKTDNQEDKNNG